MRLLMSAVILTAATVVSVPAAAQGTGTSSSTRKPSSKPPAPKLPVSVRGFFAFDTEIMAASQSFAGVTGSSTVFGFGGGGEVLNLWKQLFVRGALTVASTTGSRGFVVDGTFVPTNVSMDIGLRTIEVGGGWRTSFKKHPKYALSYGGGVLFVNYSDTSEFATDTDNVNESFSGYYVHGGFEVALSKRMVAGVEAQYRAIPVDTTTKSIMSSFEETNLGGFVIRAMFGIKIK